MRELDDGDCLADAAAVLAARQLVDPLLLRLITQPFDVDAVDDLRRWIDEVFPLAVPAWLRLLGLPDPAHPVVPTEVLGTGTTAGPTGSTGPTGPSALRLVGAGLSRGRRHDDPIRPTTTTSAAARPAGTSP